MSEPKKFYGGKIIPQYHCGFELFYETIEKISLDPVYFSDMVNRTTHCYVDGRGKKLLELLEAGQSEVGNTRVKFDKNRNIITCITKHSW